MTSRPIPQCLTCEHFRSPLDAARPDAPEQTCDAFPDPERIPDDIWWNHRDHRDPAPGDHGIQWEPREGAAFPDRLIHHGTAE